MLFFILFLTIINVKSERHDTRLTRISKNYVDHEINPNYKFVTNYRQRFQYKFPENLKTRRNVPKRIRDSKVDHGDYSVYPDLYYDDYSSNVKFKKNTEEPFYKMLSKFKYVPSKSAKNKNKIRKTLPIMKRARRYLETISDDDEYTLEDLEKEDEDDDDDITFEEFTGGPPEPEKEELVPTLTTVDMEETTNVLVINQINLDAKTAFPDLPSKGSYKKHYYLLIIFIFNLYLVNILI